MKGETKDQADCPAISTATGKVGDDDFWVYLSPAAAKEAKARRLTRWDFARQGTIPGTKILPEFSDE